MRRAQLEYNMTVAHSGATRAAEADVLGLVETAEVWGALGEALEGEQHELQRVLEAAVSLCSSAPDVSARQRAEVAVLRGSVAEALEAATRVEAEEGALQSAATEALAGLMSAAKAPRAVLVRQPSRTGRTFRAEAKDAVGRVAADEQRAKERLERAEKALRGFEEAEELLKQHAASPALSFVLHGGFAFLDAARQVVGLVALLPANASTAATQQSSAERVLHVRASAPLSMERRREMLAASVKRRPAQRGAVDKGVQWVAYEKPLGEGDAGGFVFLYDDSHAHLDCRFSVG
jgi:hypothetical protein